VPSVLDQAPAAAPHEGAALGNARASKEHPMLDLVMLAVALGFFALSVGYAYACERL
jgi:hypothetical protein